MTAEKTIKKRASRAKVAKKTGDAVAAAGSTRSPQATPRAKKAADSVHRLRIRVRAYEHGKRDCRRSLEVGEIQYTHIAAPEGRRCLFMQYTIEDASRPPDPHTPHCIGGSSVRGDSRVLVCHELRIAPQSRCAGYNDECTHTPRLFHRTKRFSVSRLVHGQRVCTAGTLCGGK